MTFARRLLVVLVFLLAILPAGARAQQAPTQQPANPTALPQRPANFAWDGDLLIASLSYRDLLATDPVLLKKLSSGLPMVIAMRAYVYREGQDTPVALATRACRVTYDLWDEAYVIHVSEPGHEFDQPALVLDRVLRTCTEPQNLPIVRRSLLAAGSGYFLGVVVDVNPVSPQMLQQMRVWMTRPTGSTGIGPADALFGNFVQLFARQIPTSDKSLTFRTQSVVP